MNNEELELLNSIKEKINEKKDEISKIKEKYSDIETAQKSSGNIVNSANKELHVARGRLLAIYKRNLKDINALYDKYDMYINIHHILNKEENDNYTRTDKINDIKNSMYKTEYTEFEEKILNVINNNLEDLDKMKEELYSLDENNSIRDLIDIKEGYAEDLKKHRENIDQRYSKEFIHKKATIPTLVTVLPKAVALSVKKVATCIKEQKEAKTNKAKVNKFFKTVGAIGQTVATPIIYAGKFIIDHWYLFLLLLAFLPKLFSWWPWWPFGKSDKDKDKKKDDDEKGEPQEQEEYEPADVKEPQLITVGEGERAKDPVTEPVPAPVPSDPVIASDAHPSAINYQTDPRFNGVQKPVPAQTADTPHTSAINYQTDPRFNGEQKITPKVVEDISTVEFSEEDAFAANELNNRFVGDLEQSYSFLVGSRHPEITIVHSAEEYVDAVHAINPNAPVDLNNAQFFYQKNMDTISVVRPCERNIIWPEGDSRVHYFENEQELAEYILSGENPELNSYYSRFIENDGNMGLFSQLSHLSENAGYREFMEDLGISGAGATVIFCLYEIVQYGLAYPTGGASLALPF